MTEPLSTKRKQYRLEKLKEQRDREQNKPRWNIKERWNGNPINFFGVLREHLKTNRKGRLLNEE